MQPYEFEPDSAKLVEQPDGRWVAEFEASIYAGQTFNETSNSVNPQNIRVIEFDVIGNENPPLGYQAGASAPYARELETEVKLVLNRNGKRQGTVHTGYP